MLFVLTDDVFIIVQKNVYMMTISVGRVPRLVKFDIVCHILSLNNTRCYHLQQ